VLATGSEGASGSVVELLVGWLVLLVVVVHSQGVYDGGAGEACAFLSLWVVD